MFYPKGLAWMSFFFALSGWARHLLVFRPPSPRVLLVSGFGGPVIFLFSQWSKSQVLVLARQQILMCSSHSGCGPQGDLRGRRRWGWSAGLGCLDGLGLLADADAVGRRINAARSSLRGGLAPAGLLGGWWQGSVGRGGRMNADLVPQSLSRLP